MLFRKKAVMQIGEIPSEEIQKLISRGMSDKDIIKQFKSQGYSYEQIENAMLQAVKVGVGEKEEAPQEPSFSDIPELEEKPSEDMLPDVFSGGEAENPETIIEELIEGVVEDKWQKFEERLNKLESEIDNATVTAKQAGLKSMVIAPTNDVAANELNARLDEMEARVGGLEKAFKQFLPSLTKNIESLSQMIHEMKARA